MTMLDGALWIPGLFRGFVKRSTTTVAAGQALFQFTLGGCPKALQAPLSLREPQARRLAAP